jgi:hypothetical protein
MKNIFSGYLVAASFCAMGQVMDSALYAPLLHADGALTLSNFEEISLIDARYRFKYRDLIVKAPSGFQIDLIRRYDPTQSTPGWLGDGWSMHFGYLTPASSTCYVRYNKAAVFVRSNGNAIRFQVNAAGTYYEATNGWRMACRNSGMAVVFDTEGNYYEVPMTGASVYNGNGFVTKVVGRYGDGYSIEYHTGQNSVIYPARARPVKIVASWGDQIIYDYNYINTYDSGAYKTVPNKLLGINVNGVRKVSYAYEAPLDSNDQTSQIGRAYLSSATLGQGLLNYSYVPQLARISTYGNFYQTNQIGFQRINLPSGGYISYINQMGTNKITRTDSVGDAWTFDVSAPYGNAEQMVDIKGPNNFRIASKRWKVFTSGFCYMNGLPKSTEIMDASTLMGTLVTYHWDARIVSGNSYAMSNDTCVDSATYAPILTSKKITVDKLVHETRYWLYDSYGNYGLMQEFGPNDSRSKKIDYYVDFDSAGVFIKEKSTMLYDYIYPDQGRYVAEGLNYIPGPRN